VLWLTDNTVLNRDSSVATNNSVT